MMGGFKTVFPDMGTSLAVDGFLVVVVGGGGVGKSALTIQFIQVEGPHQGGCPRDLELSPLRDPRSPVAPRSITQPLL